MPLNEYRCLCVLLFMVKLNHVVVQNYAVEVKFQTSESQTV